jgi:hypothetical protein
MNDSPNSSPRKPLWLAISLVWFLAPVSLLYAIGAPSSQKAQRAAVQSTPSHSAFQSTPAERDAREKAFRLWAEGRGTAASSGVEYHARQPLAYYSNAATVPGPGGWVFKVFVVGKVLEGRYKGGDFIVAVGESQGACKAASCDDVSVFRYIQKDGQLIFLPLLSDPRRGDAGAVFDTLASSVPVQGLHLPLREDPTYSLPGFETPAQLIGDSPRKKLRLLGQRDLFPGAAATLSKIFQDSRLGNVYTAEMAGDLSEKLNDYFIVLRPDGTYLKYQYDPDLQPQTIQWKSEVADEIGKHAYQYGPAEKFGRIDVAYKTVVSTADVNPARDLVVIGEAPQKGEVYGLKDPQHPLLKKFYDDYQRNFEKALNLDAAFRPTKGLQPPKKSYVEFVKSIPLFFWRDPFDRLVRFNNTELLPMYWAEPIIYLYPAQSMEMTVALKLKGLLQASLPRHADAWKVHATPDGVLTPAGASNSYPYLFWEGMTPPFKETREGFVVERAQIISFFQRTLGQLGLNRRETADFVKAWSPRFKTAPFYLIRFVDADQINAMAPLEISPKPDTLIRVLMRYSPLEHPISVRTPTLPHPQIRKGTTVVEWGGIER